MTYLYLLSVPIVGIFFLTSLGFSILQFFSLDKYNKISTVLGLSFIIFFSYLFFFFFYLNVNVIAVIFIIFFIISLFFNIYYFRSNFFLVNLTNAKLSVPIVLLFGIIAIIYGQQFYVFRGNYWDYFYYIKQALIICSNNFGDYIFTKNSNSNLLDGYTYKVLSNNSALHQNLINFFNFNFIYRYPGLDLLLSFFLKLKFLDIFQSVYSFNVLLISLIATAFNFIFSQISKKKEFYYSSIICSLSFWSLYIFEIHALRHLCSLSLFIAGIGLLCDLSKNIIDKNVKYFLVLAFLEASIFLIYPELFAFNILFVLIYLLILIRKKIIFFNNYKIILVGLLFLVIFSFPGYKSNFLYTIDHIRFTKYSLVDYWGYYGSFILGRENLVSDPEFTRTLQSQISTNHNSFYLLNYIIHSHLSNGYESILINILPSFFGLYFLTYPTVNYFYFILILTLTFYLINNVKKNIFFIFKYQNNFTIILTSMFCVWVFFSIILLLTNNYWGLIKLYFYFFILFLFIAFFKFKKEKNFFYLKPNKKLLFLLLLFPIYKYSVNNNGIGRLDSFPSIINQKLKNNFSWDLNVAKVNSCNNIIITSTLDFNKENSIKFIYLKLLLDYNKLNYSYRSYNTSQEFKDNNYCKIFVAEDKFIIN